MPTIDAAETPAPDLSWAGIVVEVEPGSDLHEDPGVVRRLHDLARSGIPVVPAGPTGIGGAVEHLAEQGITGRLVLVVLAGTGAGSLPPRARRATGVPALPAAALRAVLDDGLARRRGHRVPDVDDDPRWTITLPAGSPHRRVAESLGALANGTIGTRASLEEDGPGSSPLLVAAGVYTDEEIPRLVEGPAWATLALAGTEPGSRTVDLRTGVLHRSDPRSGLRSVRFVSAVRPAGLAMRAEGPPEVLGPELPPVPGHAGGGDGGGLSVAVRDRVSVVDGTRVVERIAAAVGHPCHRPAPGTAEGIADALEEIGVDALLAEHRAAWAARWRDAEVTIEGAPEDELAARFAVFHLLAAAAPGPEAAVGPRGLTGPAYGGHVFWDADVYVLPALAAIHPGAARAMLGYRTARLAAAQAEARQLGLPGARFPWESAAAGSDVTPLFVRREGHLVEVLTDDHEEHIVADVAWAADRLVQWTGDEALAAGPVRQILQETARYWAGRLGTEPDPAHLRCVMGPDEYHERVDDDAFTNVMARWNLRRAAAVADDPREGARWLALAEGLVDGWDDARGCHEQFAGYWDREPLLADQIADPPFAADLVLGAERVAGSQLVKQPDVLLLHHLVPHEVRPGSLAADLAVYDPRTVHGSSLSPAIHSSLHARARRPERALEMFRVAARLDLDDLTGTTAGGLHLATMGGLWQALAHGFLGIEVGARRLSIDPCLPDDWTALEMRMRYHGHRLGVRADHESVHVSCDREVPLVVAGRPVRCRAPGVTVALPPRPQEAP